MSFKKSSLTVIATLALAFSFSAISFAKSNKSDFPSIKISNFGQMDQNFYRGARPKPEDFKSLAALGIKTVIDLTDNSRDREQPAVEAAGMRYVNIPIVDKENPSVEQISAFLKLANNPA